jgi:UDPglucose--hexose-1-phosphate uridylyltransferase
VPNLYPVLGGQVAASAVRDPQSAVAESRAPSDAQRVETGLSSSIDPLAGSGRGPGMDLFSSQPATGAHEVIVSTPRHAVSLAELSDAELTGCVAAWRERMRAHPAAGYLHLIVNEGPASGASLEHSHAQLYALDFVPAEVARERERATAYYERTMGSQLLEDVASEEVRRRERLVAVDDEAVLVCPWASRAPFELRVIPRRPAPRFELDEGGAAMIGTALRALGEALGRVPQLNLWIRTAPRGTEHFGWHVDIVPRVTVRAGFELGTGVEIDVYPPERAAADLRSALR